MSRKFIFVNGDGDYEETQGAFEQSDFINSSAGAADAGRPVVLDAGGRLDGSFIDDSDIDHGAIGGLTDDDHTQYIRVDGTRAFTGSQDMGGNLLTGLAAPVGANDAARKAYVDAVATGLRVHGNVAAATTGNISLASAPATIDGYSLSNGDRILVKNQTVAAENGIYLFNGAGSAMTRAEDFDNSPTGEIYNGEYIPKVLNGSVNQDVPFVVSSVGTGTDGLHQIGIDNIVFDEFTSPTQLQEGNGIDISSNIISVDLLDSGSGLHFAGAGTNELAIDWASTFTIDSADDKAFKASDLASTANGEGASIVGIEDSAGNFTATDVEAALAELASMASADFNVYTAGAGGVSKGDLVYVSGNDTVLPMPINAAHAAIGVAGNNGSAGTNINVLKNDAILAGVLSGATAGTKYYWTGSAWLTSMPSASGSFVWMGGVAKNGTDVQVETRFIKRNS